MPVSVFIVRVGLCMAQTEAQCVPLGILLLINGLGNQGVFVASDIVVNIGQYVPRGAFLVEPLRFFPIIGAYYIEYQGLLVFQIYKSSEGRVQLWSVRSVMSTTSVSSLAL